MKYPDGSEYKPQKIKLNKISKNKANLGMPFEAEINKANELYQIYNMAVITKRPTPIKVVKIIGNKITQGFFEKNSTTDYNGVVDGYYIDFEAKSTLNKKAFPLQNIYKHQLEHLNKIIQNKGIAFFLIKFSALNEVYFLHASFILNFIQKKSRKSIPLEEIKKNGFLIKKNIDKQINVDFLPIVKKYIKK